MKFLQFTDIHLTTPGQTIAGRDPNENFRSALDHAISDHADAETIVITGDLSDWGARDDYVRLKQLIAETTIPVRLCIGNHDDRETFLSVFPENRDEQGFAQHSFPLAGGIGIALDTWAPDTHAGAYCAKRCDWLSRQLLQARGKVWLFMHHHPVPLGLKPLDTIMLQDADAFAEVVASHRAKIGHIFFGHCHIPLSGSLHGVPMSAPRGTNHAGFPNYKEHDLLTGSDLPEAYAVVTVHDSATIITMVEYGYHGRIHIEASPDYADWDKATMQR